MFGREGGFILPLTVTIAADGAVTVERPGHSSPSSLHLSADTLNGLRTLAAAEHIDALPDRMVGRGNPDVGGRFIAVQTATGTKTVHVRYVRNVSFDELYAVLTAVTAPATGLSG